MTQTGQLNRANNALNKDLESLPSGSSDPSLEETLADLHRHLQGGFRAGMLQRPLTVFQFHFDTDPAFTLTVHPDAFTFSPGHHPEPTLNLYLDRHSTCRPLLDGSEDAMQAFMAGRYRADGNIVLSQLLLYLFKSADPVIRYAVQD